MATPVVDIRLLGDKALERKLAALATPASQGRAIRPALKKSAKRLKEYLVVNLSGKVVTPRTGRWLRATIATKVRAIKRSRHQIGSGFPVPTREALGIDPKDPYYYPFAVEYGHIRAPAKAPIRLAVNENTSQELNRIGIGVGDGIEKEAMKQQ